MVCLRSIYEGGHPKRWRTQIGSTRYTITCNVSSQMTRVSISFNSIGTTAGTVIEWLANGEDLLGLARTSQAHRFRRRRRNSCKFLPWRARRSGRSSRALREWFREFVLTHMGRPLTAKALDLLEPLNRVLERDERSRAIVVRPDHPRHHHARLGLELRFLRRWSTPKFPCFFPSHKQWRISSVTRIFPS